jgi:short coiled-coil protein
MTSSTTAGEGVSSLSEPSFQHQPPTPSDTPIPSPDSSAVASDDDTPCNLGARPKLGSRKSSGTMIVPREQAETVVESDIEEGDVRTMSPRRSSEEVDKLGEAARKDLIEQAKLLQMSLQAIVDRVEVVKSEHEKLEGGNKFLQSYVLSHTISPKTSSMLTFSRYIGELMQTSKITSSVPPKKGKGRSNK